MIKTKLSKPIVQIEWHDIYSMDSKDADKCEKKACIFIQIGLLWSQFKNDKGIDTYRIVHKLDTDRIRVYSDDDFIDIPMSNVLSKKKIGTLIINWEER